MLLLVDIGGTYSKIGVSGDGMVLDTYETFLTPSGFEETIALILQKTANLTHGKKIDLGVIGVCAPLNNEKSQIVHIGNIPGWFGKPIKSVLQERFQAPIMLENDAALAALGEACFGAGNGYGIVGYLTFSTGTGGAKVVNGQIDAKRFGFEPAFMITHANMNNISDGINDEIGHYLSSRNIEKTIGQKPENIKDPRFWEMINRLVAITINNAIVMWSPDVIVIGGGIIKNLVLENIIDATRKIFRAFPEIPEIRLAELGDYSGLFGALQYSKSQIRN